MAKISEATTEQFRRAVSQEYGREITFTEAATILNTLVDYYDLLAKIYHREKTENNNDDNNETKN